ncbi:acyl-CoA N-acyltransferase [Circinella umbellata]|nr:acyl-CoA N-acyltransferase [Circinella umbellata]
MSNHNSSQSTTTQTNKVLFNPNNNNNNNNPSALLKNNDTLTHQEVPIKTVTNEKKPRLLLPRPKDVPIETQSLLLPPSLIQKQVTDSISTTTPKVKTMETNNNNNPNNTKQSSNRKRKTPLEEEEHHNDVKVPKTTETTIRRTASPSIQDTSVERPRNIEKIIYGRYQIGTWYYSPYPSEYGDKVEELFICEHCLKYTVDDSQLRAHKLHCKRRKPPGQIIYQQDNIKIYEIDGREHKLYCQNLCLMSKLFLETKTLYYDVEGFTFYVLTEQDRTLDLFVGYFSKEKISYDNYNLACIMVLPSQQRKGYGRLLIELSYEISKYQGIIGSPEKPLSSLGELGYRSYWASTLIVALRDFRGQLTIQELSKRTTIHIDDVIDTLTWLNMLKYRKIKNNNQQQEEDLTSTLSLHHNNSGVTSASTNTTAIQVCINNDMLENAIKEHHLRLNKRIDPSLIRWKNFSASSSTRNINNSNDNNNNNNDNNNDSNNNDGSNHLKNTSSNSTTKHDNVSIIK